MLGEIVTVGSEILSGDTLDTNFQYLATRLQGAGVDVRWHQTVGDRSEEMADALRLALSRADLVVATGGLGPTPDDLTRKVVATVTRRKLVLDDAALQKLRERFARAGIEMPRINETQALVPLGASLVENPVGSAPGLHVESEGKHLVVFPGVPSEMRAMTDAFLIPWVLEHAPRRVIRSLTLRTFGVAESAIAERIGAARLAAGDYALAYLPQAGGVDLRVTVHADRDPDVEETLATAGAALRKLLGDAVFGEGTDTLPAVVLETLRRRGERLAVAESVTGGRVAAFLTAVPGSSDVLDRGFVTYSDGAKVEHLGVDPALIARHGAVSEPVARAMAEGVRRAAGTAWGIASTGIAGPAGATPSKPVGLIYFAAASEAGTEVRERKLLGERDGIQERAALGLLNLLRLSLR
jgi:nicotinamide-nucleotide amidase